MFFIDNFDLGLHLNTLFKLWKMIREISEQLSIVVFASCHSSDCLYSFHSIWDKEADNVTMHKIQRTGDNIIATDYDLVSYALKSHGGQIS